MLNNRVKVAICKGKPVEKKLREAIELIGGIGNIAKPSDKVLIKPNWVFPAPPPVTTSPILIKEVVLMLKEIGVNKILIGDSSAWRGKKSYGMGIWSTRDVFEQKKIYSSIDGIRDAKDEYQNIVSYKEIENLGAELIDFDEYNYELIEIKDAVVFNKAKIFKPVLDADVIINMPVMKTHMETLISIGIKNYHGILHDLSKMVCHKVDLSQKLVDIHKKVKTDLTIVDGTRAIEGFGPVDMGSFVDLDLVIASRDVVAADAVSSAVMGFEPMEVDTTRIAHFDRIGIGDLPQIELVGKSIEEVKHPFKKPDNRVSGIYPGIRVIVGGACLNCHARTRQFLDMAKDAGFLNKLNIKTIIFGPYPNIPDLSDLKDNVLIMGDCAIRDIGPLKQQLAERIITIAGCSPSYQLYKVFDEFKRKFKGK